MVQLQPMTEEEYGRWMSGFTASYAASIARTGRFTQDEALERAKSQLDELIPEGLHTPEHYFYTIVVEETPPAVGVLWVHVQERLKHTRSAFIYEIEIAAEFRRRGYARQTLAVLEQRAKAWRVDEIGLHVFGYNHAARVLYQQFGFIETDVMMTKKLS